MAHDVTQLFSPSNTIMLNSQMFAMTFVYKIWNWKSLHKRHKSNEQEE